jgi:aspartyl aminopeptidase
VSKRSKDGYLQVAVELYGGGIWHSWLDRDLSLAGRVVIAEKNGTFSSKLLKIERPLLRIPTLAIHCKLTLTNTIDMLSTNSLSQWTVA